VTKPTVLPPAVWTMTSPRFSDITTRLASISDLPALDATVLLAHILGKSRTWVHSHPELELSHRQWTTLDESLRRLESGEPLPYLLGHWEFLGLDFKVTPDVLIPRPETELLVEKAIAWLEKNPERRSVADVGTGSGIIAISLAVHISDARILATDISPAALQVAMRNAEHLGVSGRIEFVECNLLPKQAKTDILCANLPYIPTETLHNLPVFEHEPVPALDGGADGFETIRSMMQAAPNHLKPHALMLFEIESTLGGQAIRLAQELFPTSRIRIHQDPSKHDRLLEIELP